MKISKKFNDFVYFTFPFINGLIASSSVFSRKNGGGYTFPKKWRGWENRGGSLLTESNLCLLLIFVFVNPRNITI